MNKPWKVVLAFIVIFAAGAATGWVVALRHPRGGFMGPAPRPQAFSAQLMMQWMRSDRLKLTPEERDKIRPVVFDAAEQLRRLRQDDAHAARLIIEKMQDSISAAMTPEQRDAFQGLILQQRQRMQRFIQEQQRRAQAQEGRGPPP